MSILPKVTQLVSGINGSQTQMGKASIVEGLFHLDVVPLQELLIGLGWS